MIEILSQSALATVQDAGRTGALRWGVGTAGAMDRMALACGNLLLGNPEGAAAIEVQVFPFEARFLAEVVIALTGADCGATLDGVPLLPWSAAAAADGAVLRLGLPEAARWRGSRAYLCVGGGIDVPVVLGSRATQLRGAIGGLEGRALRQGDRVPTGSAPSDVPGARHQPRPARPRAAPRARRHAGRAGAARRRIRRLHGGFARRVLVRALEGHAPERPLRLPARRTDPRAGEPRWSCARTGSCRA